MMEPLDAIDAAAVTLDRNHSAEQVRSRHRRIAAEQAVAARREIRFVRAKALERSVNEQPVLAHDGDDIARRNLLDWSAADRQDVTGLDGRHHARSGDAKSNPTERFSDLYRQLDAYAIARIVRGDVRTHATVATSFFG
jgi:hypothetical protein